MPILIGAHKRRYPAVGLTLLDSLLAIVILSFAVLAISFAANAGHRHLHDGAAALDAVRLAEQMIEEIISRPYSGSGGPTRASYHVDDYNQFEEAPGTVTDSSGVLLDASLQEFSRAVSIIASTETVSNWESTTISGKLIRVSVTDGETGVWTLERFLPEPTP